MGARELRILAGGRRYLAPICDETMENPWDRGVVVIDEFVGTTVREDGHAEFRRLHDEKAELYVKLCSGDNTVIEDIQARILKQIEVLTEKIQAEDREIRHPSRALVPTR
ncbi:Uncharacterised protein [Mycobacteroides abscessus subsp. abscessus]|nr:Uncharacterised protein [Mycobacteroides abscessus subsp. abscessus]